MEFKAEEIQQQHEEEEEEQQREEEEEEEEEENERGEEEEEEEEHFHVLAVDDSSIDRKILEKLLTGSSYQVTCVESGDKALEYLGLLDNPPDPIHHDSLAPSSSSSTAAAAASATTTTTSSSSSSSSSSSGSSHQQANGMRVNLIMTDYSMPGMSGYDLLKRVKGSSWKDVPVIIMSSENVPSRIDMCMEGGAEEFLLKPVQMADLKRLQPHLLKNSSSYGKRKAPMSKHSDRRIKFEFEGLAV